MCVRLCVCVHMCQLKELYVTNLLEEGVRKKDKELVYKGQDKSGDLRRALMRGC